MKDIFTNIYKNKIWYKGSGSGSLPTNTAEYREFLQDNIKENNIKSVLDLGCGDWQFSKLIDWSGIDYLGVDVVDFLIEENNKKYSSENVHFQCVDGFASELPKADLLIMKDVIQHWSNDEIIKFFAVNRNRYPYILVTNTGDEENENINIKTGEARSLNLLKSPFNFKGKELFRYKSLRVVALVLETKVVIELRS